MLMNSNVYCFHLLLAKQSTYKADVSVICFACVDHEPSNRKCYLIMGLDEKPYGH